MAWILSQAGLGSLSLTLGGKVCNARLNIWTAYLGISTDLQKLVESVVK